MAELARGAGWCPSYIPPHWPSITVNGRASGSLVLTGDTHIGLIWNPGPWSDTSSISSPQSRHVRPSSMLTSSINDL